MINLQTILDNAVVAKRAEEMLTSPQMTLGELILKLEGTDGGLPIVFDDGEYKPTGLGSWRGSYKELAIRYEDGGSPCYDQPGPDCERDEFGDHAYRCKCGGTKEYDTSLPDNPTVGALLKMLRLVQGKYIIGYKGGDFTMGKTTPVWVANYGTSSGFKGGSQGVVDVKEQDDVVAIITKEV